MNPVKALLLSLVTLATLTLRAGELSPEVEAKFLKVIMTSSGATKIACSDAALKTALEAVGIVVDPSSSIVWASNMGEAKMGKMVGRLVVTNKRELASQASILLEEDGGRPKILVNTGNLHNCKVQVGDAVLKLGEKI